MKVKDSPLYKTLCEAVRKEDHAELLRMLEMVPKINHEQPEPIQLICAFTWCSTPQGHVYWRELSDRLQHAGWECW